jgi:hypothetical protein
LSTGYLLIDKNSCPNLKAEFASYVWDEKASLRGEDKPKKENDHALDALRYIMMNFSEGPSGLITGFNKQ